MAPASAGVVIVALFRTLTELQADWTVLGQV
jgi:hypothetical protein